MKILLNVVLGAVLVLGGLGIASVEARADITSSPFSTAAGDVSEYASKVVIYKSKRRLELLDSRGRPLRVYNHIALGKNPVGPKQQEGDQRTPEGDYFIDARKEDSDYFLALRISYPSEQDRLQAQARGARPGGQIMIHGLPNGRSPYQSKYKKGRDWTEGCIGLHNDEMREIWRMVPDGTPVTIKP